MPIKVILISNCGKHRDVDKIQHRGGIGIKESEAFGQWLILGTPVEPNDTWKCGTDVVWPVLDAQFYTDHNPSKPYAYVCRHMFEGAD